MAAGSIPALSNRIHSWIAKLVRHLAVNEDIPGSNPGPAVTTAHDGPRTTKELSSQMILYHATTPKKAKLYRHSGRIIAPVRGFTTPAGAMAWAMKTGRTVIMSIECPNPHKLPDHHNPFGEAWWNDGDVLDWTCIYSASGDLEGPSTGSSDGLENRQRETA